MSCILFVYFVLNTYTVKQSQPWDDPTCNTNDAHKYTVHIHGTHTRLHGTRVTRSHLTTYNSLPLTRGYIWVAPFDVRNQLYVCPVNLFQLETYFNFNLYFV